MSEATKELITPKILYTDKLVASPGRVIIKAITGNNGFTGSSFELTPEEDARRSKRP